MRILELRDKRAIIQVDATELDTILNDFLDQQHMIGYDEGYNDWARTCNDPDEAEEIIRKSAEMWANADMDDDDSKKE